MTDNENPFLGLFFSAAGLFTIEAVSIAEIESGVKIVCQICIAAATIYGILWKTK